AGEARLDLVPGKWAGVVGSLECDPSPDLEAALERRLKSQQGVLDQAARHVPEMAAPPDWIAQLLLAADSSIFKRPLPGRPDGKIGNRRLPLVRRLGPRHDDLPLGPDARHRPAGVGR